MARVRRSAEEILLDELTAAENKVKEAQQKLEEATNDYNKLKKEYDEKQDEKIIEAFHASGKTFDEVIAFLTGETE